VAGTVELYGCREQHKKLDALETELAAARQEGFVSKPLIEINGTYSRRRPLVVIGILTKFGRQKNRDAIRKAWMGSGIYILCLFSSSEYIFACFGFKMNRIKVNMKHDVKNLYEA